MEVIISVPAPFMRDPDPESSYDVGDSVEVFCDHEKGSDRIRGWMRGVVVQVDQKMVAVQFNYKPNF